MLSLDDIIAALRIKLGVKHTPVKLGSLLPQRLRPKKQKAIKVQNKDEILQEINKVKRVVQ